MVPYGLKMAIRGLVVPLTLFALGPQAALGGQDNVQSAQVPDYIGRQLDAIVKDNPDLFNRLVPSAVKDLTVADINKSGRKVKLGLPENLRKTFVTTDGASAVTCNQAQAQLNAATARLGQAVKAYNTAINRHRDDLYRQEERVVTQKNLIEQSIEDQKKLVADGPNGANPVVFRRAVRSGQEYILHASHALAGMESDAVWARQTLARAQEPEARLRAAVRQAQADVDDKTDRLRMCRLSIDWEAAKFALTTPFSTTPAPLTDEKTYPFLLIPGHDFPLSRGKCAKPADKMALLKKKLNDAYGVFNLKYNKLRDKYRADRVERDAQQRELAKQFRELWEVQDFGRSTYSEARYDKAIENLQLDLLVGTRKLNALKKKARKSRLEMEAATKHGSALRKDIESLEKQIKDAENAAYECMKKEVVQTVLRDIERRKTGKKETEIPDLPQDTPPPSPGHGASTCTRDSYVSQVSYSATFHSVGAPPSTQNYTPDAQRMTMKGGEDISFLIMRTTENRMWSVMVQDHTYTEMKVPLSPPEVEVVKDLGVDRIDGIDVAKCHMRLVGPSGTTDGIYWLTPDSITLKAEADRTVGGQTRDASFYLSDLVIGPQDSSLFNIPAGFSQRPFQ